MRAPCQQPTRACRYHFHGVCVYAEAVNPGLERTLRCPVLAGMIMDWDDFLDRAEAFDLSEAVAARIWSGRKHGRAGKDANCLCREAPVPSEPEAVAECRYRFHNACLLAMPLCGGRCERFAGIRDCL